MTTPEDLARMAAEAELASAGLPSGQDSADTGLPMGIAPDPLELVGLDIEEPEPPKAIRTPKGWEKSEEFQKLREQYGRTKNFWQTDRKKLRILHQDFISYMDHDNYRHRSKIFVPKIYTAIRQMVARSIDAVTNTPQLCLLSPYMIGEYTPPGG